MSADSADGVLLLPCLPSFMTDAQTIQPGTVIEERYVVESLIGAGGFSEVLAAHDRHQDRPVALKVLHAEATHQDPRAVARMRQEAEILRAIDHPNIVRVFELGTFEGGQFLAMERIDGIPLNEVLEQESRLETERLLPLVFQLLDALCTAHDKQILHRDLKPANILLTGSGDAESLKLVDFGVAKAGALLNTDDPDEGITLVKTRAGNFVGTPRYSAPETVVGDPPEPCSDLFCVGLIVYEALTGEALIQGTSQSALINELVFPNPFDLDAVPESWQPWLSQLLEKSPMQRVASAEEALAALKEAFPAFELADDTSLMGADTSASEDHRPTNDESVQDSGEEKLYPAFGDDDADHYEPTVEQAPPDMSEFDDADTLERPASTALPRATQSNENSPGAVSEPSTADATPNRALLVAVIALVLVVAVLIVAL